MEGLLRVGDDRGDGLVDAVMFCCGDIFEDNLHLESRLGVSVDFVELYDEAYDCYYKKVLSFEKNQKTRIIKEAIYSEENKHHINGISFKSPVIWKPTLLKTKERKTTSKNSTAKNTSPSRLSPEIRPQRKPTNQK